MTRRIAYLTWGNGHQLRCFHDFAGYLDDLVYVRDLDGARLRDYAAVVVPDGMDSEAVRPHAAALDAFVRGGGFLVVFGGKALSECLEVIDAQWLPIRSRDWLWWTRPGDALEIRLSEPRHPIGEAIPLADMSWHWQGVFAPNPRARSALELDDGSGSLLLDFDGLPGGGRVVITSLAPHVHNGERFMPATTRFLKAFYPWLNRELDIDRRPAGFTVTYLQCLHVPSEWRPAELERTIPEAGGTLRFLELYDLDPDRLAGTDILYIPNNQDQFFLRERGQVLLDHLSRGGHLIVNSEPAIAWLPFLGTFRAVPPRPFTNIKVRVRNDPLGFFRNMDADYDGWRGIFGQYARGWSQIPPGGLWLTDVGPADDPRPADWLWKYPTDDGRGGYVFMHNGDNMIRYPDHGPAKEGLVRDICVGLAGAATSLVEAPGYPPPLHG